MPRTSKFLPGALTRQFSTTTLVRNPFPLPLPKNFSFTASSVIYSNGQRVVPDDPSPTSIPVHNPATEELLQCVDCASPKTVKSAITDAQRLFRSGQWSRAEPTERFHVLNKIAALLREQNKELAACNPPDIRAILKTVETMQTGRPIREMTAQLSRIPEWFEYHASLARTYQTDVLPFKGNVLNYTNVRPLGVVALITPWNHPLLITIKKLAPALAAGNSLILKPSEKAPLSVSYLVSDILHNAGIPKGTVQVLLGDAETAQSIVHDDRVKRIDFTGGTNTGRILAEIAGRRLVPITAELGGKTAVLVCEDCGIDEAVEGVLAAGFIASGQTCVTGSRVIVQERIYERFVERLVKRTGELKVGRPWEVDTQIGAVIDRDAVERCQWFVEMARKERAKVLVGGEPVKVDGRGHFFLPTSLGDCQPDHTSVQTEIFGPVISILRAKSREDMLEMANHSPYTLAASIWTQSLSHAHTMARSLNAGIVWINAHHLNDPSSPWGGWGESGLGRENGYVAFRESIRENSVVVNLDEKPMGWFANRSARYG